VNEIERMWVGTGRDYPHHKSTTTDELTAARWRAAGCKVEGPYVPEATATGAANEPSTEREVERLANDLAGEWRERAEKAEAEVTVWKARLVEETARLRQINRDLRAKNEWLREALAHVINRVSTERRDDAHGHIFAVGKAALVRTNDDAPSVPELVERSRALGPVMEAQGDAVAGELREAADRMREEDDR
jgi:hypothetical protein